MIFLMKVRDAYEKTADNLDQERRQATPTLDEIEEVFDKLEEGMDNFRTYEEKYY